MGWIVAIYGGIGGGCMPLITFAQDLIQGTSATHQLASFSTFVGWILGVVILALIGGAVSMAIEQSHSERIRALAVGLTLPATLTAITHGSLAAHGHVAFYSFFSTANAQPISNEKHKPNLDKFVISIDLLNCKPCQSVIFLDKSGKIVGAIEDRKKEGKIITAPGNAATATVSTPSGLVTTRLPMSAGEFILRANPISQFILGLLSAFGVMLPPYAISVSRATADEPTRYENGGGG